MCLRLPKPASLANPPGVGAGNGSRPESPVGRLQRDRPMTLARRLAVPPSFAPIAEGAHDSARMTEIPPMSSLFLSTID